MSEMSRRSALAVGAAAFATPLISSSAGSAETDVVVIGAGAAGIAAARDLAAKGLGVTLIEASGRVGGRVWTETTTFGVPHDVGAHWLHYRENNPFADYGIENGFDIYRAPDDGVMYVGAREATEAEARAFDTAQTTALKAMSKAGRQGKDVSPASVIPDLGDWQSTVNLLTGPYEIAKDMQHFSCKDWWSAEDGTDYYCREGFGALFAHSARDVPVSLGVAARLIRWGGNGVEVDTDAGLIRARAVVVTVSMGVLGAGELRFDPPLPARKQEAISVLTMGHYNHVALKFRENFFGTGEDGYYSYRIEKEVDGVPHGFAALIDAAGTGIAYCDLGGEFARQMAAAGPVASVDFVLTELEKAFGAKVRASLITDSFYDWSHDPLVLGAYSAAEPGGAWARAEMRKPEGDRIWFAGEALSADNWATVAGAHQSGRKTARKLAKRLAG